MFLWPDTCWIWSMRRPCSAADVMNLERTLCPNPGWWVLLLDEWVASPGNWSMQIDDPSSVSTAKDSQATPFQAPTPQYVGILLSMYGALRCCHPNN